MHSLRARQSGSRPLARRPVDCSETPASPPSLPHGTDPSPCSCDTQPPPGSPGRSLRTSNLESRRLVLSWPHSRSRASAPDLRLLRSFVAPRTRVAQPRSTLHVHVLARYARKAANPPGVFALHLCMRIHNANMLFTCAIRGAQRSAQLRTLRMCTALSGLKSEDKAHRVHPRTSSPRLGHTNYFIIVSITTRRNGRVQRLQLQCAPADPSHPLSSCA